MTISCKICGHKFTSSRPAAEQQMDVLVQMTKHLGTHQEHAATMKKTTETLIELITTWVLITDYVTIPPDQTELLESLEKMEDALAEVCGFEKEPSDDAQPIHLPST